MPEEFRNPADPALRSFIRSAPDRTLESLARSIHKEGVCYGLNRLDFVQLVNLLLDCVIRGEGSPASEPSPPRERPDATPSSATAPLTGLPCTAGRVKLRPIDLPDDYPLFERWLSEPHGRQFMLSASALTHTDAYELLQDNADHIAIVTRRDDTPIGAVAYLHYDVLHRRAELRKLIGDPSARRQGFAREATEVWIRYGFDALGLRKIYLNTLDTNLRNIRLNESLGFVVEGILHNDVVVDGRERDVLRMGLCRHAHTDARRAAGAEGPRVEVNTSPSAPM